jgi:hypothetical protein
MSSAAPVLDFDTEANALSIQAAPGAVFLRLKRERADGTARRMFVELTVCRRRSPFAGNSTR